jgi:carbamoyl-phosphate synthase large subunit
VAKLFAEAGFKILATGHTYETITEAGTPATLVKKLQEGRPNILDMITNGDIDLVVNSPIGKDSVNDDSYLRKAAIKAKIPYVTTIAAANATAKGILYVQKHGNGEVKSLQEIHQAIRDK